MDFISLLICFLLGFGAFFKRMLGYNPGEPFVPFDQIDFVIGALIFVYPFVDLTLNKVIVIIILSFVLHILVNHFAFYTKIRKEKW